MAKILLNYVFPISIIAATPAASTAFLKQVLVVAKPKAGQEANVGETFECTSKAQVATYTDNTNADELFDAGMTKVFLMLSDEADISGYIDEVVSEFWTVLFSDDYSDADITATAATGTATISSYANLLVTAADTIEVAGVVFTAQSGAATLGDATFRAATSNDATAASLAAQVNAHAVAGAKVLATVVGAIVTFTSKLTGIVGNTYTLVYDDNGAEVGLSVSGATLTGGDGMDVGSFKGVVGYSSTDEDYAAAFAATENQSGWFHLEANGAKNMFYAFGKLLSNLSNWTNQQYITMPANDGIDELGEAVSLFDDRVSFVLNDSEFGNRLGLFCAGGKAIVAPYIGENLRVDLQSAALSWIAANQPAYTKVNATLLETRLQEDVINVKYLGEPLKWIEAGTVTVALIEDNFVANGYINIAEPKALWRIVGEMRSTL